MNYSDMRKRLIRQSKFIWLPILALMLVAAPLTLMAAGAKPSMASMHSQTFTKLAETASPAVVNIRTVKTYERGPGQAFQYFFRGPGGMGDQFKDFFEKFFDQMPQQQQFQQRSLGSGFIIDAEGYIVTNHHVVKDADQIQVKVKNGKEYPAEIIGTDPPTDLALLKIEAEAQLPVLKLGNSDKAAIGQWVLAIGNPFGLEHTVTSGIISAKGRVIGAGPYDDFIQTDTSINPGNSGGPLLNMDGEVIGINTAIVASGEGIGFAVPSSMAKDVISQLKQSGEVTRGWLGVGIQDLTDELKEYYNVDQGVLVARVFPGDPAAEAGIKANDVIVAVNGQKVNSPRELSQMISELPVGEKAEIKVRRDDDTRTFEVTIAKRDDTALAKTGAGKDDQLSGNLGFSVSNITPRIAGKLNVEETAGVLVASVEPDGKGAKAGIREGDIIKEINHKTIGSVADYQKIMENIDEGDEVQFLIKRPRKGLVVVELSK